MSKLKVSGPPPSNVQKSFCIAESSLKCHNTDFENWHEQETKHIFPLIHDKNLQDSLPVTEGNVRNL